MQVEAALASAEHQIERLRSRERMHARALVDARHQLVEASCASSVISEDVPLTPEAGLSSYPPFLLSEVLHAWHILATKQRISALPRKGMRLSGMIIDLQVNGCRCSWVKRWMFRLTWCDMDPELAWR
jgi:hypothetical protein